MSITMHRLSTIISLKFQTILSNLSIMVNPIVSLVLVFVMRKAMGSLANDNSAFDLPTFLLGLGLLINTVSGGILISSSTLAEEKEKNTLQVLMTSSIRGFEYMLGSLIPTFLIIMAVNILIVPASGMTFEKLALGNFLLITSLMTLISILIGSVIGIYSKNQAQAGVISMPILLLFTMVPQFRIFSDTLEKISKMMYSGILTDYLDRLLGTGNGRLTVQNIAVISIWIVITIILFIYAYKKRGIESD